MRFTTAGGEISANFGIFAVTKMTRDVELGLIEVRYGGWIGRDIGCGSQHELGMLWRGLGGRLGVDRCAVLKLAGRFLQDFGTFVVTKMTPDVELGLIQVR